MTHDSSTTTITSVCTITPPALSSDARRFMISSSCLSSISPTVSVPGGTLVSGGITKPEMSRGVDGRLEMDRAVRGDTGSKGVMGEEGEVGKRWYANIGFILPSA